MPLAGRRKWVKKLLLSVFAYNLLVSVKRAEVVDRFDLKLFWVLQSNLLVSKYWFNWEDIIFSSTLEKTGRRDMARQFHGSLTLPDSRIGTTIECFQTVGKNLDTEDVFIVRVMWEIITRRDSFINFNGMLSDPQVTILRARYDESYCRLFPALIYTPQVLHLFCLFNVYINWSYRECVPDV